MTNTQTTTILEVEAANNIDLPRSKVAPSYKRLYAEREAQMVRRPKGISRKALARCNGDWLAIELARYTLDEKAKPIPGAFAEIAKLNGVDMSRFSHLNPGQQRMSGGLALRAVVAEAEELVLPSGEALKPTRTWLAKHQ